MNTNQVTESIITLAARLSPHAFTVSELQADILRLEQALREADEPLNIGTPPVVPVNEVHSSLMFILSCTDQLQRSTKRPRRA